MNLPDWLMKFPHKVIAGDCWRERGPMMVRWFIFRTQYCSLMVHCFLRSDAERHLHDHPWNFLTFLLSPYVEHTPAGSFRRRRFSILYRPAHWQHRVEIAPGKRAWTVVLKFRQIRNWGFITERGWIPWQNYTDRGCPEN